MFTEVLMACKTVQHLFCKKGKDMSNKTLYNSLNLKEKLGNNPLKFVEYVVTKLKVVYCMPDDMVVEQYVPNDGKLYVIQGGTFEANQ